MESRGCCTITMFLNLVGKRIDNLSGTFETGMPDFAPIRLIMTVEFVAKIVNILEIEEDFEIFS